MIWLWYNIVPLTLIGIAAWLAFNDKSGWGWFLLIAVICIAVPNGEKCKCDKDKKDK